MLEGLQCVEQATIAASLALESCHAMRGQLRSAGGDFIVAKHRERDPDGCPVSPENDDICSAASDPPPELFPSVSWVDLDDVEATSTSASQAVAKSLMKCPYSRKRLKRRGMIRSAAVTRLYELDCTTATATATATTTTKKKRRNSGKGSSEADRPPCLPYIIIG
jgi:hypothetical protein